MNTNRRLKKYNRTQATDLAVMGETTTAQSYKHYRVQATLS
jgi:hypothetical protein